MMVCTQCKISKPESSFNWHWKDKKRHPYCKKCFADYQRRRYKTNPKYSHTQFLVRKNAQIKCKDFVRDYLLSHPCTDCGESDPVVLDFDHVRGEKILEISRLVKRRSSIEVIQQEIEKCDVRCANCHRRQTHKRRFGSHLQERSQGETRELVRG